MTPSTRDQGARCPTCGKASVWEGNPVRPFCSVTCKLVDLGEWLDEAYRVPGPPIPSEPTADADQPRGDA
ncbi:MAG: DNA gyrase inhibitor YacG [Candidatus Rokubacteria bacterium]|nr:DNA gyrase inhibitor YacG [Candidatus Rokubacteria bacterium]